MTDIEKALAKALDGVGVYATQAPANGSIEDLAATVLATEPMQAIARQAAIGAAVERLPRTMWLGLTPDGWCVLTDDGTDEGRPHHASTIPEAIAAALEDDR